MTALSLSAALLALIWGVAFALFLQHTKVGAWLCDKRTWLTVVIGIGVDLLILMLIIPGVYVMSALIIIALSAVGIIARSIINELAEHRELERINGQSFTDECDQQP